MFLTRSRATAGLLALTVVLSAAPLRAQSWISTTDRNWGVAGNWNPATIPNSAAAVAIFDGTGPGAIDFGTGGTAFTVNALNFTGGGYTLAPAGTVTLTTLTNSAGTNVINSRLVATNLAATISGGTLTLGNVRGGANANSLSGTFTATNGGTLDAVFANADVLNGTNTSSSLGNANVVLNGGILNLRGNLVAGGLTGQVYPTLGVGGNLANINNTHPDFISNLQRNLSLFGTLAPESLGAPNNASTAALDRLNTSVSQGNGQTFVGIGSSLTTHFTSRWSGVVNITTAGNYTFGTRSDDGSILYVDGNQVANNNFYQGMTTRSVTVNGLTAGQHRIDIFYYGGGGGNGLLAGYSGPDNGSPGLGTSDAAIQAAAFPAAATFGRQGNVDLANNAVTVGGTSTINLTHVNVTTIPTLDLQPAVNLTLGGTLGLLRSATTNLTGTGARTFTVNATTGNLAVGNLNNAGGAATIVKTGVGSLIFDSLNAANPGGGLIYDIRNGRLVGVTDNTIPFSTDLLGTAAVIQLNGTAGNTPIFQMRTRLGDATFNNAMTVTGTGGTVEAVPIDQTGFSSFQLGGPGRGITLTAGTLTFDVFGGGDGANVDLFGQITGAGNLAKSVGTGFVTLRETAANTYAGTTTVSAGALIGMSNTSFGTGAITVNNNGTLGLRGNITVNNVLSLNGAGAGGRSGALEVSPATTIAGAPTYGGNITLAGSATIGMAADSVAPSFTINGNIALGANTLTLNPAGGDSPTSQMLVNGVISGTGNVAKAGALEAVLANDNTYTGTTTVNSGRLIAQGNTGRAVGAGAAFINAGSQLLVNRAPAIGNVNVTLNGANSNLRFETGGTTNSTATAYTANEGSSITVTGTSIVSLPSATLAMTGAGTFNGLREGWVRTGTALDAAAANPNNGINGGVVTNIRMASITTRTGGTAAGVDNPGPANGFAWPDNTTYIYTGEIQARVSGFLQFAEQLDDRVYVSLGGTVETGGVNNNGVEWFRPTSTRAIPVVAGQWYPIDIRLFQGGGGAGPPGSGANGGWGIGWVNTYGFGLAEATVGDGLIGAATSITDSQTNAKYNGANYFKPGETADPLGILRFRANTTAAFLNVDAGSSVSVRQITGGGFIALTGTGGVGAALTLLNQASATASSAGQVTFAGDFNSTLTVGALQTFTLSGGVITPAAAISAIKNGTGTMIVNGPTNLGAGSTVRIDAGTVRFNGVGTGTGAVLVQSGSTIGGSGTLPGAVNIGTTATLQPGNSVGTLTVGSTVIASNAIFDYELGSTVARPGGSPTDVNTNDRLVSTGTVVFATGAGSALTVNVSGAGLAYNFGSVPYDYYLVTAGSGTITLPNTVTVNPSNFNIPGSFATSVVGGTAFVLTFTPVPEPASVLAVCAGVALVSRWRRKR